MPLLNATPSGRGRKWLSKVKENDYLVGRKMHTSPSPWRPPRLYCDLSLNFPAKHVWERSEKNQVNLGNTGQITCVEMAQRSCTDSSGKHSMLMSSKSHSWKLVDAFLKWNSTWPRSRGVVVKGIFTSAPLDPGCSYLFRVWSSKNEAFPPSYIAYLSFTALNWTSKCLILVES